MPYYSQKGVALFKKIMTVELLWIDCFHHDSRIINYNRRFFIRLRIFYERRQVWLDLTKIHHFGEILYAIGKFLNAFIFCKLSYQLWHFYAYGKIIIVVNCQRLNNNNNNIVTMTPSSNSNKLLKSFFYIKTDISNISTSVTLQNYFWKI